MKQISVQELTDKFTKASENVEKVYNSGVRVGKADGIMEGKKAEHDIFWDAFQNYGARKNYNAAFSVGWNIENFKPKYNIIPDSEASNSQGMFCGINRDCGDDELMDMSEICSGLGIAIDVSHATNLKKAFSSNGVKRWGELNFENAVDLGQAFYGSTKLEVIDKIISSEETVWADDMFEEAGDALRHCIVEGSVARNINIPSKNLDKESITSIIYALSNNIVGKITLSRYAINKAFETAPGAEDGIMYGDWSMLVALKMSWEYNLI